MKKVILIGALGVFAIAATSCGGGGHRCGQPRAKCPNRTFGLGSGSWFGFGFEPSTPPLDVEFHCSGSPNGCGAGASEPARTDADSCGVLVPAG